MAVTKSCLGIALAISIFLLRAESQLITKVPQGAPDDVWTVEEREAFLQQAGFRFPMTHGVLKQVEGEDGAPAKVVARADTKSAEYAKWQRLADIRRARGRRLKVGDVIDYTVGGGIASALRNSPGQLPTAAAAVKHCPSGPAYYITISLGSKQQKFNVQVDTGSDLLWVPCDCIQCANDTAYSGAPFSPVASGTTEFESCESRVCASLAAQAPQFGCNVERRGVVNASDPNCEYWYAYADNSSTFGNLVTDSFNFQLSTGESLSPRLLFGCSSIQDGNLVDERNALDGLIGLGGGDLSVFQQLEEQGVIANTFALCLEGQGVGGHLFLGTSSLPSNAQYIELLGQDGETFYRVDLVGLQVAGQDLPLDASIFETDEEGSFRGSILDSGTTFTLLPTDAWTALAAAVGDAVGVQFFEVGGYSCLGLRRPLTFEDLDALFPMVAMVFGNGTAWDLPPSSYLFFNGNRVCIAALDAGVLPLTIIASSWMRNFFVLHDRSNNRIGFVPFNCTSLQPLSAVDGPAAPPTENPVAGADDSTAGPPPPALPAPSPASSARPPPPPPALTLTPTPSPTSSPTRNVPPPPNKAPPANEASPSSTNAPPLALPPPAASSPAPRSPPSSAGTAINSTSAPSAPKSGSCHLASLVLAALACIASGAFAL